LRKQKSFSKSGKLLCLMLAVVLTLGAMPMYGTFASAGTDEPTVETTDETPTSSVEPTTPEPAPAPQGEPEETPTPSSEVTPSGEPEASPAPGETPTESPEPEDTTYANSISGVLWIDVSEDGIYDSTELPLVDYPVYLYVEGDTDNAVDTAMTDTDGTYEFINITSGRYVVGIKAEENGTDYLLPMVGVQNDNKFYFVPDWSKVISNPIDIDADTVVEDIDAAMRNRPGIQPMANATYTININSPVITGIPGVTYASNVLTFTTSVDLTDTYIITGTGAATANRIVVNDGVGTALAPLNITLDGVNISNAVSPLQLAGTTNVKLTLSGTNTLRCTATTTTPGAIQAGIYVPQNATITIEGTGALNAYGGSGSAGIGEITRGGLNPSGTIAINSGTIIAAGGNGSAGIGGGVCSSNGTTTINGGTVTATSGYGAAGIGSGLGGGLWVEGGTITINGGTVTAIAVNGVAATDGYGVGAGIGMGWNSDGNLTVLITGGTVTATGGNGARQGTSANYGGGGAGIGSGGDCYYYASTVRAVTITGGTVTATGGRSGNNAYMAAGIGGGCWYNATNAANGTNIFTGGSIYPTNSAGVVSVSTNTTNGPANGNDLVSMATFTEYAGQAFTINTSGSLGPYTYSGVGHTAAAYPWLTYPGVSTDAATVNTTAASVTAPSTVNSTASSTATLNGTYYLNNTYAVTQAYFEWGTSTGYGTTINMTGSINTSATAAGVYPLSSPSLTGLVPGMTYHYRFVIVTNGVTVAGDDMTFTSALAPSVDVTHTVTSGTAATLYGIYDLNGGTFSNGEFEISTDGGSIWTTPTGGTLTGASTTPSVNLTGLTTGATYQYRFTVTNSEGTTISSIGSFQTGFAVTEKFVNLSGSAVDSTGLPDNTVNVASSYTASGIPTSHITGGNTYTYLGYKLDSYTTGDSLTSGTPSSVTITGNRDVYYVYAIAEGSIKIEKYAHDGTTLLPGAEFQLEKLTGPGGSVTSIVGSMTTGAGGSVTFANLSAGSYRITETKAPAGYELLTAAFEVDIPKDITYAVGTPPADSSYLYSTTSGSNVIYHYYDVTYKVSDQASIAMPSAGAAGDFPPYALWGGGLILLASLGGGILWLKRRRTYAPKHG